MKLIDLLELINKPMRQSDLMQKWRRLNPDLDQDAFYMQISNAKKNGIIEKREDDKIAIDTSLIREQLKEMKEKTEKYDLSPEILEYIGKLLPYKMASYYLPTETRNRIIKIINKQVEVIKNEL